MRQILIYSMVFILISSFVISCAGKKEEANSTSLDSTDVSTNTSQQIIGPASVLENGNENPKLTIINLIRSEPYNPNGYRLFRYGDDDKYGNHGKEQDVLIVQLTENQVNEIKKYQDAYIFWDSEFGKEIVNKMIACFQKKQIICDCGKNVVEDSKKEMSSDCSSNIRAYEFGREMATMVKLGASNLSSAISEYGNNLGIEAPYSSDEPCVKTGYDDEMQGVEDPYNKDGKSWNTF